MSCKYPGCNKPCFRELNGRVHDYCGRTHANQAMTIHVQGSVHCQCVRGKRGPCPQMPFPGHPYCGRTCANGMCTWH